MRFDLTVPFARFAAQHIGQLGTPFKRYHIGPVWRGENTQHGRYREFYQCDFDTIGTDENAADIETVLVIHDLLAALGFERFCYPRQQSPDPQRPAGIAWLGRGVGSYPSRPRQAAENWRGKGRR